jgi:hypothetical protein
MLFIAFLFGAAAIISFFSNIITFLMLMGMTAICILIYFKPGIPAQFMTKEELKKEIDAKPDVSKVV